MLPVDWLGADQFIPVNKLRLKVRPTANKNFSSIILTPHNRQVTIQADSHLSIICFAVNLSDNR